MKATHSKTILSMLLVLSLSTSAAASNKLIETIPDDAFLSILIERPQRALPPTLVDPALKAMFGTNEAAQKLGELVKRIPGPIMIGWVAPHKPDDDPTLFVVCEMDGPQIDVDALMEETLLPALAAIADEPVAAGYKIERGKLASRIMNVRNGEPIAGYAVKDKLIFISSEPMVAKRWAQGDWPKQQWIKDPGIKNMLKRLPKEHNARAFFNHMPLVRLTGKPKPNSPEELIQKVFRPEDLRGTAIDLNWDSNTLRATANLMISEEAEGVAELLVQPAETTRMLGVFPDEFVAVGRLGWTNANRIATWLYRMTDMFDDTISAEYEQELAEFESETGVDWNGGVLGNLVGELVFGVRVDFTKPNPIAWAIVCPLADTAGFSSNIDKLIEHYDLPLTTQEKDGLTVRTSKDTKRFSFCVSNDKLLVADAPNTIMDILTAEPKKDAAMLRRASLRKCHAQIGGASHFAVLVDIGLLSARAPVIPMLAGPKLGTLITDGTVGLAVKSEEGLVTVDLNWALRNASDKRDIRDSFTPGGDEALVMLAETIGASMMQARRQARRVVSMSNMRGIGQALYIYANDHQGKFPDSLEDLLRAKNELITLNMLVSPYDGIGPKTLAEVAGKSYLAYRPGLSINVSPLEILLAERRGDGEGACFLFQDGHVEYIKEPEASQLIAAIERGDESVIPGRQSE